MLLSFVALNSGRPSCAGRISRTCVCSLQEVLEPIELHFSSPQYLTTTDVWKAPLGEAFLPRAQDLSAPSWWLRSRVLIILANGRDQQMISDNEHSSFAMINFQLSAIVNSQEAIESKAQKFPSSFLHLLNPLTAPAFRYHSLSTFQLAYLRGWEVWTDGGGFDELRRG